MAELREILCGRLARMACSGRALASLYDAGACSTSSFQARSIRVTVDIRPPDGSWADGGSDKGGNMSVMSENDMEKRRKDATGAIKRLKQLTERDMNLRKVLRQRSVKLPPHEERNNYREIVAYNATKIRLERLAGYIARRELRQTGIEKVSDHAKSPWKLGPHRLLQVGAISREEYEADRSESSWKTGDE